MGIENLNRFAWIVIGAFIGAALGYVWSWSGENIDGMSSTDPARFEADLVQRTAEGGPLVKGVIIHPPEYSPSDDTQVNLVTYKRLVQDKTGKLWWADRQFVAQIPYTPARGTAGAKNSDMTIEGYLAQIAAQDPNIKFHYGWWLVPRNAMLLGLLGGVVLIGGIWPTLMNIMIGAGLGPKAKPKDPNAKPLWKYKSTPESKAAKAVVSAAQQQQLQAITDAYAQNLRPDGSPAGAVSAAPVAAQPVQQLQAGPLEKAEPMKRPGDDDDIEVKGEYYPVLIHHHKEQPKEPATPTSPPAPPGAGHSHEGR